MLRVIKFLIMNLMGIIKKAGFIIVFDLNYLMMIVLLKKIIMKIIIILLLIMIILVNSKGNNIHKTVKIKKLWKNRIYSKIKYKLKFNSNDKLLAKLQFSNKTNKKIFDSNPFSIYLNFEKNPLETNQIFLNIMNSYKIWLYHKYFTYKI